MVNKIGPIHSDGKKRRMDAIYAGIMAQNRIAKDIKDKDKIGNVTTNDKKTYNAGLEWFESGFLLEEADEKLRKHPNFISGFNHGKRAQFINQLSYETGIEWFNKGILLEEIPENYRNNKYFMDGYNSYKTRAR